MKKKLGVFLVAVIMAVSIMYPFSSVNAKENVQLDVILVLDQSGSMKTNDPNHLMKEAAKNFITMMPSNSRTNIITFNRKRSKWQSGLTSVSSESQINSAVSWIDAVEYTGDTDVGNAVADAVEMFDENDGRVHAILVFSDGRNDFGFEKNKENESDERLNDALVTAKKSNVQIYCIGYGDEMANTSDTPYKKLDSIAIANSSNRITTKTDAESIDSYFTAVIAELMNTTPIPVVDNKVKIASNVKEANISITCKEDISTAGISLLDPDGNTISFNNNNSAKLFTYKYSAIIKLYDPKPGVYTIQTNKNVKISATYIPYYEYTLKSSLLDSNGNEITEIDKNETVTIKTIIQQNDKDITTTDTYDNITANAVVTAKDTKESKTVNLSYKNGYLTGSVQLDRVATYDIQISVKSDSFQLSDVLTIKTNKRAITVDDELAVNNIGKQVIDKTFKKSATKTISMDQLNSIVEDPDNVGFEIVNVVSSDTDHVTVQLNDDGLELTGLKWGSSNVTVTYEDSLGNSIDTSFTVKVTDKALVALFAAIPFIIGLIVLLIVLAILRKSRLIRGNFTIEEVTINDDINSYGIANAKTYPHNVFLKRKKTLAVGIEQYANDIYNQDFNNKTEMLHSLMNQESEIKQALDKVKFIGTYLGRNGCKIVIKEPRVSYGGDNKYGATIKELWKSDKDFTVYVKDSSGLKVVIKGHYSPSIIRKKQSFDSNMDFFAEDDKQGKKTNSPKIDDFDDFDF